MKWQSTAVAARRTEPADSLDFFPTPPWATRALCEHVLPRFMERKASGFQASAWDPACGEGHMALALDEAFREVRASDIHPYGFGQVGDFLHPDLDEGADWIITNPPFNLGLDFIAQALRLARQGVAMLVRLQFLEGEERFRELFSTTPPAIVAYFVERVPMHRARWVVNGRTATAYCWIVWSTAPAAAWNIEARMRGPRSLWIPPSRRLLSLHDDWLKFSGCMDIPEAKAGRAAIEQEELVF